MLLIDSTQWRKVHDGDVPSRYEHAVFTVGSDLFVYAGAQTTGPLGDMWKYKSCMYHACTCMCIHVHVDVKLCLLHCK